jgi:hypothetical protein
MPSETHRRFRLSMAALGDAGFLLYGFLQSGRKGKDAGDCGETRCEDASG